ncbi:MAG: hypothetical protein ACREP2_13565 [Rhodanobacteraceae bacterium]
MQKYESLGETTTGGKDHVSFHDACVAGLRGVDRCDPAFAHAPETRTIQLELFGVPLKGATRTELRAAILRGGLKPIRVDDHYIADEYDPRGVLAGASELIVNYTDDRTQQFAIASYKFDGFMDVGLVTKVERLVASKYGPPDHRSGDPNLGPVDYRWYFPGGMMIEVGRDWPDTTTFLDYTDNAAWAKLKTEAAADKAARERAKAKAESSAF